MSHDRTAVDDLAAGGDTAGWPVRAIALLRGADLPDEPAVVLPAAGEPVSFDRHIKTLFRDLDRHSMLFAFDLWDHVDVVTHAAAILTRLHVGTMPCDGPWPPERIAVFARWIDEASAA